MKKYICILFLTSCSPAGVLATSETHHVLLDGIQYSVQKMPGTKNSWAANKTDLSGGMINPEDYAANIKAIESYTGCRVNLGTVVNKGMNTKAAVEC